MWNTGRRIPLQSQPFRILVLLISNPNELVTREDIRRALWNEETSLGFDNSINASMNKLRGALEDSAPTPRYIETLSRRGYRFIVPVEWSEKNAPEGPSERQGSWLGRLFREGSGGAWQLILASLVLALLAAILFSNASHSS